MQLERFLPLANCVEQIFISFPLKSDRAQVHLLPMEILATTERKLILRKQRTIQVLLDAAVIRFHLSEIAV